MNVSLDRRTTCALCGSRLRGFTHYPIRVNRRSLKVTGTGLGWGEPRCHECGFESTPAAETYALDADSQAKVAAYRARRWAA